MKKIFLIISLFSSFILADTVSLKTGWNLIGIPSTLAATSLSSNSNILSATGGGVGGGGDFTYDKNFSQYASGNFILGQGYWVKVDADTILEYEKASTPSSITLKTGWNLIHPFTSILASDLVNYSQILSATGGGVGGGGDFTYDKNFSQYASGETIAGQGYWVKVSENMVIEFIGFDYRAWGIAGDAVNSMATIRINGVDYSVLVYSKLDIDSLDADNSGNFTSFVGTILGKTPSQIKISGDYSNEEVQLKIFASDSVFDSTTLVFESDAYVANNSYYEYGNLEFTNENDYSVPQPESITDLNPPTSPVF